MSETPSAFTEDEWAAGKRRKNVRGERVWLCQFGLVKRSNCDEELAAQLMQENPTLMRHSIYFLKETEDGDS